VSKQSDAMQSFITYKKMWSAQSKVTVHLPSGTGFVMTAENAAGFAGTAACPVAITLTAIAVVGT